MQETLQTERSCRKQLCVTPAQRRGWARPSEAGFYYGFEPSEERNVILISDPLPLNNLRPWDTSAAGLTINLCVVSCSRSWSPAFWPCPSLPQHNRVQAPRPRPPPRKRKKEPRPPNQSLPTLPLPSRTL